jgi:hypothetical protein
MALSTDVSPLQRVDDPSNTLELEGGRLSVGEERLIVTPQLVVYGARSESDAAEALLYLNTTCPQLPQERAMDPQLAQELTEIVFEFNRFGRDLGIDLRNRLPMLDHFHIFDEDAYQTVREMYGLQPESVGVHSTSGHMLVQEDARRRANTLGTVNHELLHVGGFRAITLTYEGERICTSRAREGYERSDSGDFCMFNEAITEVLNCYMIRNYWSTNETLRAYHDSYDDIGYTQIAGLTDRIFSVMERELGVTREELLQVAGFDYLTGSDVLTDLIGEIFLSSGHEALKQLDLYRSDECARRMGIGD